MSDAALTIPLRVRCSCGAFAEPHDIIDARTLAESIVRAHPTHAAFILDDTGSRWPITGHWCPACGWPLGHVVLIDGFDEHPTCDEEDRA